MSVISTWSRFYKFKFLSSNVLQIYFEIPQIFYQHFKNLMKNLLDTNTIHQVETTKFLGLCFHHRHSWLPTSKCLSPLYIIREHDE